MYLGLVPLGTVLSAAHLTKNTTVTLTGTPQFADAAPTFRIYGPQGLLANATGSLAKLDPSATGGPITGATNAKPIVITSANHGLTSGTQVTIAQVLGNTAANGDWQITVIDSNTFSLNGSTGGGIYTSGGVWWTTGLYLISYTPIGANGFASGTNYVMLVSWVLNGIAQAQLHTFTVT